MRAVDIDNDSDIDLFGVDWQKPDNDGDFAIELWRNTTSARTTWVRHLVDDDRPGRATFVFAEDIGSKMIVADF